MKIRKHIPPDGYDIAHRLTFPLLLPLTVEEESTIAEGKEVFYRRFPDTLLFPDPFVKGRTPARGGMLSELQVVYGSNDFSRKTGEALVRMMHDRWGLALSLIPSDDPLAALDSAYPRLYLGSAHDHERVLEITRKYQIGLFSSEYPGDGGWGLTTHWELEAGFTPCYLLTCDPESVDEALKRAVAEIASADNGQLRWVHHVTPAVERLDFERWVMQLKSSPFAPLDLLDEWLENGRTRPYREVPLAFLTRDYPLSEGIPYNGGLIDPAVRSIRRYQETGCEPSLELFRETLRGFWDYFNSTDPQIYPSDIDFRLGLICNYWNWIQFHPAFSQEERHANDRLLLGITRMVRDYYRHNWKWRPAPHNHQTFKGRTLVLAWRYFRSWDLPDVPSWRDEADCLFSRIPQTREKFMENANFYERLVFEHRLVWLEATNQPVSKEMQEAMANYSLREWAMWDNFLQMVDYGDGNPDLFSAGPMPFGPWLTGETTAQRNVLRLETATRYAFRRKEPETVAGFTGLAGGVSGGVFPSASGWISCPLDPDFAREREFTGPPQQLFDKLVWRTGWKPESDYLALEGIGLGARKVSHAHHETNGILRANLGGRIWLIRSGYGKKPNGRKDAGVIFSTRQLGPEEHNMLVMRDCGTGAVIPPPPHALLRDLGEAPLPYAVSEVEEYAGASWRRHLFILPSEGFVVIDRVSSKDEWRATPELQWNALGHLTPLPSGATLEQNGSQLYWNHFETVTAEWKPSDIFIWRELISKGAYPDTDAPPIHCVQKSRSPQTEQTRWFVNCFSLQGQERAVTWNPSTCQLSLTISTPSSCPSLIQRPWGELETNGTTIAIRLGKA